MVEGKYQSYGSIHTQSEVCALVESVTKTKTRKVERIDCGEVNAVYSIDNKYVLKVSPQERGEK